jgi:signal transduction histidine kinase
MTGEAGGVGGARMLRVVRVAVLAVAGVLLAGFVTGVVLGAYRGQDRPELFVAKGWSSGQVREVLADWGVPVGWFVGYWLALDLLLVAVSVVAGYFILRGAVSWFRLYLVLVLVLHATAGGAVPQVLGMLYPQLEGPAGLLQGLGWFALFPLAYVFPDGRFVPGWSRWLLGGWAALVVALITVEPADPPTELVLAVPLLLLLASCVGAQVYRYRWVSGPVERRQTRWVMFAVALRFAHMIAITVTPLGTLEREASPRGLAVDLGMTLASYLVGAVLPAAIAVAIVRYRLFDIDVWINRALVYGILTGFVVGTYALVVAGIGGLWPGGGVTLPLLATGLVAVAFSPVRERVQRAVNRLVYGRRDEPYLVVSQLGRQLAAALPPDAVLQTIVDTLGRSLKLRYVRAALAGADDRGVSFPSPAPDPPPADQLVTFSLRYHDQGLGVLQVATRPGENLSEADRVLLAEVTRQAGIAVRAATLTTDLRRSRERVVAAREEERRRLHRDLHDGLGPTMASLYQRVDAARGLLSRDLSGADQLLDDAGTQIRSVIADIRRLVYSLRPPTLDELGLVPAIEEACQQLNAQPDRLTIDVRTAALPPLPAVVEVAAYRIAIESVTNLVRHAGARHGTVCVTVTDPADHATAYLCVEVTDDGTGIGTDPRAGVGLRSMRERAEEIGGALAVTGNQPCGTVVRAQLPLAVTADDTGA